MEGFPSAFSPYTANAVCAAPVPDSGWVKRQGRFLAPPGLNYLELCKAIIAQVNPGAGAPHRRAHTKECGVQVNAKVDKAVQCSLGPKTLFCQEEGDHQQRGSPHGSAGACVSAPRSPPPTPQLDDLRLLRPVSIYSPAFDRRPKKLRDDAEVSEQDGGEESAEEVGDDELKAASHRPQRGSKFQFLEQRYGFFHCKQCSIRWESAYVWCISGTSKVYYKQLCRKCQQGFNPYRVESILCKGCCQTSCICEKKQRHINMKKPHRQDLCCRCKGMKLSCDATYSFKYIV